MNGSKMISDFSRFLIIENAIEGIYSFYSILLLVQVSLLKHIYAQRNRILII